MFSYDFTWVDRQRENREVLERKARNGELTLYLPRGTPLTSQLALVGAHVVTYEALKYKPESRFTMINVGRAGAQVAIGHASRGGQWVIEEFSVGSAVYHLAADMTEILDQVSALSHGVQLR